MPQMQKIRLIGHVLAWALCIVACVIALVGPFAIAWMAERGVSALLAGAIVGAALLCPVNHTDELRARSTADRGPAAR